MSYERLNKLDIQEILKNEETKAETVQYPIRMIAEDLNRGSLIIDEEYQRNYLYEDNFKIPSRFVESVFMRIVIPEIQLFRDTSSRKREIIDGQQRVLSLIKFYNNEYKLVGLELLPKLNGYKFRNLPEELQDMFADFLIQGRLVSKDSKYKYAMFERLNTGSKQLNKQEVRNCVYRGKLIQLAKKLSSNKFIDNVLIGITNKRFDRTEFLIRLMALTWMNNKQVETTVNKNINSFLELQAIKNIDDKLIDYLENQCIETFKTINSLLDYSLLFKINKENPGKAKVSKNIIEPIYVAIYNFNNKGTLLLNKDLINDNLNKLINSKKFIDTTTTSSTIAKNTNKRINYIVSLFTSLVEDNNDTIQLDTNRFFSNDDRYELWVKEWSKNYEVICPLCGNKINGVHDCEVDHIIPWSKGGQTVLSNAQLVHSYCNKKKSNKNM